jgi:phosphatidylinositol 4-kinase
VRKLARLYPKVSVDSTLPSSITLEKRNLDAALAIEVFLLESELQHKDKILPLLLNLLKCLSSVKFNEANEVNRFAKGCLAEEFTFHFVSLLLEIASLDKENSFDIVLAVLHTFQELIQLCCNVGQQTDVKKSKYIGSGK